MVIWWKVSFVIGRREFRLAEKIAAGGGRTHFYSETMTDNLRIRTPPENVEEIFLKKRNTIKQYKAILNLLVLFTCVNVYLLTMMVIYNELNSFIFGIIGTPIFIAILYQGGQIYAALSTYGELSPQQITVPIQKKGSP